MEKKIFHARKPTFFLLLFLCVVAGVAVLKITASAVLPLVIAILLSFALFPLINKLDKLKIPRIVSILLIVAVMAFLFYILGMLLYRTGINIAKIYPKYEKRLTEVYETASKYFNLPDILNIPDKLEVSEIIEAYEAIEVPEAADISETDAVSAVLDQLNNETLSFWELIWGQSGIRTWILTTAGTISRIVLNFLKNSSMIIIYMVFILLEASYFREKLNTAFKGRFNQIDKMGKELIEKVTRYLTAKFFISLATGGIITIGLWLIGVEFFLVWGIIAFIFNFIPTFGSIAAGFSIGLFSLVQFYPDPLPIILTVVLVLAVNMVVGNIIDPVIIGENVGLSTLVVLVSLLFWGYVWGFVGMVLSVPLTSIIKIICENIPPLEPVAILLGSRKAVKAKKAKMEKPQKQEKTEA